MLQLVPASLRVFSNSTIDIVSATSRTSRWRRYPAMGKSRRGADVVALMQQERAENNLPPLSEDEILTALVKVEDARLAAQDDAFEAA